RRDGLRRLLAVVCGTVVPLTVAVAWTPLRDHHPNVDVALALVIVVTALGVLASRTAVALGAISAGFGFAYFDTLPFDRLVVSKTSDLATGILMVAVGLLTGELALRVARQRRSAADGRGVGGGGGGDLDWIRDTSAQLASGEELVVMLSSVCEELTRLLGLRDCAYDAGPVGDRQTRVERDGTVTWPGPDALEVSLPVWGQGHRLGQFVLHPTPGIPLGRHRLLVAVTLADQVGAALFAQAPPPAPPLGASSDNPPNPESPAPTPHLRVVP
ncbi:MAG: DUF4118 domain-containing protein, partial [Acidimicrobiales bacterium]